MMGIVAFYCILWWFAYVAQKSWNEEPIGWKMWVAAVPWMIPMLGNFL